MLYAPGSHDLERPESVEEAARFSYFSRPIKNTLPERSMTLLEVYRNIKSERNQWQTMALRSLTNREEARRFKSRAFDYVTFSGVFSRRSEQSLIQPSGLLCIDLDHVPDLLALKLSLLNDHYFETQLQFVSPSGDGLKWIVAIDHSVHPHGIWFSAIVNYLHEVYGAEADASGKDISRACYLPWDPDAYLHPKYLK